MSRLRSAALALLAASAASAASAGDPGPIATDQLPAELRPFVLPGTQAIEVERGDLNGDGRADVVLVLERRKARPTDDDIESGQRPILILVRQADGRLRLAARNDTAAYCSTCGGMMGDPFMGIEVGPKALTVQNYGGSAWRWSSEFRFGYSSRDDAWQLVRVTDTTFHAADPEKMKTRVRRPPKDFGKIDFSTFDPERYVGKGPR